MNTSTHWFHASLSVFLSFALALSLNPLSAHAAGGAGGNETADAQAVAEPAAYKDTSLSAPNSTDVASITHDGTTTTYASLAAAFGAAAAGDTVALLENVTLDECAQVTNKVSLDLRGKTVTSNDQNAFEVLVGALTITDSSDGEPGAVVGTDELNATIVICPGASFELDEGTIKGTSNTIAVQSEENSPAKATITGGSVITSADVAIEAFGEGGVLNIEGGSISGTTKAGIVLGGEMASLTVKGGTIAGPYAVQAYNTSNTLSISDGRFTGTKDVDIDVPEGTVGFVAGGVFAHAVPAVQCAAGSIPVKNDDGTYGVAQGYKVSFNLNGAEGFVDTQYVKAGEAATEPANPERYGYVFKGWYTAAEGGEAFNFRTAITADTTLYAQWSLSPVAMPVAKIGTSYYETLCEAAAAVQDGQTIVLLRDAYEETTVAFQNKSNVTLDLNGHTVTYTIYEGQEITPALSLSKTSLTVTDATPSAKGSIKVDKEKANAVELVGTGSTLVLEKGQLSGAYAVYNESAGNKLTVAGGTLAAAQDKETDIFTAADNQKFISGGFFSHVVPASQLAQDCVCVQLGSAYQVIKQEGAAARIGDVEYASLAAAFTAAKSGNTVTLLRDVAIDAPQEVSGDITLDLDNHNIVSTSTSALNVVSGTLTIADNSSKKSGVVACANGTAVAVTGNTAGLTVYSGIFIGNYAVSNSSAGQTLNIAGGEFRGSQSADIMSAEGTAGFISHGAFVHAVPLAQCAEGYVPSVNSDGTYSVMLKSRAVAETGGLYLTTLDDAFSYVKEGGTITMLGDVEVEDYVWVKLACTLNLNGKTIALGRNFDETGAVVTGSINVESGLTVKDSSTEQTGKISSQLKDTPAIYVDATTSLTIEGGTFESTQWSAIETSAADVSTLSILGGKFVSSSDVFSDIYTHDMASGFVTGGVFSHWVPEAQIAEGYECVKIDDNIYGIAAVSCTATFDANGGVFTDGSTQVQQTVGYKETLAAPDPAPTRAGYTFKEWTSDAEGKMPFDFATPLTSNVTLYAQWTKNPEPEKKIVALPSVKKATYDASEQTGLTVGKDALYTATGTLSATNAGDYTVTLSLKDKANCVWTSTGTSDDITLEWTIAKKAASIKVDSKEMTVGGQAPEFTGSIEGVVAGDDLKVRYELPDGADITKVGTYGITAYYTENSNYEVSVTDGTLTVTGADKTALEQAIFAGNTSKEGVKVSTDGSDVAKTDKWVTQEVLDTLNKAIEAATAVVNDANASQASVDAALAAMAEADEAFQAAKKAGTKVDPTPTPTSKVVRIAGDDRYSTMQQIVNDGFTAGSTKVAVLATGENFPDALAASSVAGAYNAPVLLTEMGHLSDQAKAEIKHLGIDTLYVLGGNLSVSDEVLADIAALGQEVGKTIKVTRVSGDDRTATSLEAMNVLQGSTKGNFDTVIVASGKSRDGIFGDVLSISPYAYAKNAPILLTDGEGVLTADELAAIKANNNVKNIIIVGGSASVADVEGQLGSGYNVTRLAGETRYETSAAIATWELTQGMSATSAAIATGQNFPDALAGAALSGVQNSILLLADNTNSAEAVSVLETQRGKVETLYVYGGTESVSESTQDNCARAAGVRQG